MKEHFGILGFSKEGETTMIQAIYMLGNKSTYLTMLTKEAVIDDKEACLAIERCVEGMYNAIKQKYKDFK